MELNVGDYIRTRGGKIAKFIKYDEESENELVTDYYNYSTIWDGNVIKVSSNIIDLIEVGDYVNGWRVNRIEKQEGGIFFTIGNITSFISKNETDPYLTRDHNDKNRICKIESIVTKEQFEAMQYVVRRD